jgi:prepilin-type N-terminal cleavage/methylation domain-containing protein
MMKKAFTLIEIMIVLVVIGLILAFAVPSMMRSIDMANAKACGANIRALNSAIHMFYAEHRSFPTGTAQLCTYMPAEMCNAAGTAIITCPRITNKAYNLVAANAAAGILAGSAIVSHFNIAGAPDQHDAQ